jgi:hypothetical protein
VEHTAIAFEKIQEIYPKAKLEIYGSKMDSYTDINRVLARVPSDRYEFFEPDGNVFSKYQNFDLFIHVPTGPSEEAFGLVYLEALAAGVPSIFTRSGILNELEGSEFVYLDDYDPKNTKHVVVTFDGPYSVILEYAAHELFRRSIPFELYVIGDYINGNNEFDTVEPLTNFCTLEELKTLVDLGGRLQWHTRTHQLGNSNSTEDILREFTVPDELFEKFPNHFKHFAYPHGSANLEMRRIAETLFVSAASVDEGDVNDKFYLPRVTVSPSKSFKKFDLSFNSIFLTLVRLVYSGRSGSSFSYLSTSHSNASLLFSLIHVSVNKAPQRHSNN